jgi:hypothetical protein
VLVLVLVLVLVPDPRRHRHAAATIGPLCGEDRVAAIGPRFGEHHVRFAAISGALARISRRAASWTWTST